MRRLLAVLLFFSTLPLCAQTYFPTGLVPKSAIKFSPLHLFNFYPTFQVAYEHQLASKFTLQGDVGYVLNYGNYTVDISDQNLYEKKRGVKLKLEARLYLDEDVAKNRIHYFGFEPYANIINFDRTESGPEECLDGSCTNTFIRRYKYLVKYREQGFAFKLGKVRYYDRVFLDVSLGIMMRFINYNNSLPDLFPEASESWDWEGPNETDRTVPSPHFGVRIGYRLK